MIHGRRLIAVVIGLIGLAYSGASGADKVVFLSLRQDVLPTAVGADAFTVGGSYYTIGAFLWMPTSGDTRLGGNSTAAISRDGRTIIGNKFNSSLIETPLAVYH